MKTLILGDLHGNTIWEAICKKELPDRLVCLGDYFDSFDGSGIDQLYNLKHLIDYTDSARIETILLMGNHDFHYKRGISESYSGYQPKYRLMIESYLHDERDRFRMCYSIDNFLLSHAGVSSIWLDYWMNELGLDLDEHLDHAATINDIWHYKPNAFCFHGSDPYGDSVTSSPIWIRPRSLQVANKKTDLMKYVQIVGHTQQNKIDTKGHHTGGKYYYIDTLNTSKEYALIEDSVLSFGRIDEKSKPKEKNNPVRDHSLIRYAISLDAQNYKEEREGQPITEWTEESLKLLRF